MSSSSVVVCKNNIMEGKPEVLRKAEFQSWLLLEVSRFRVCVYMCVQERKKGEKELRGSNAHYKQLKCNSKSSIYCFLYAAAAAVVD